MENSQETGSLQPWIITITALMTSLAFVCVCLRMLSRYEHKQSLWWDDYMIILSMIWNVIIICFVVVIIRIGLGLHVEEVGLDGAVLVAKYLVAGETLYLYNLAWTKISILLMYYRIFRFPRFKIWAYIIGTFVIIWAILMTFVFIFICVPVQKMWYPELPGHCINQVATWVANGISTIVTDLAILVLPMRQSWNLQMNKRTKIALTVTFCLGFFVVFASTYRLRVLFSYDAIDPTYTLTWTIGWSLIEISTGIMSACLPTTRPAVTFLARMIGIKHFTSSWGSAKTANGLADRQGTAPVDAVSNRQQRNSQHAFTRIPDDGLGDKDKWNGFCPAVPLGSGPDKYVATVTKAVGLRDDGDNLGGDEVPLHAIRIKTNFERTENSCDSG